MINFINIAPLKLYTVLVLVVFLDKVLAQNQTRAICYSGSNLYQRLIQDCNDEDSSYVGSWYCSTMEVSEVKSSRAKIGYNI